MNNYKNKIYARVDERGIVIKLFSSVFEQPLEEDILIEEGTEEYHAHVHLKYKVMDMNGRYNYKYEEESLVELTEEEKEELFPVQPSKPSEIEVLKEQLNELQQAFMVLKTNLANK